MLPLYDSGMISLLAETPRDQDIIDYLVDHNKKLGEENRKQMEEIDEYKKRNHSTIGIKNGKSYEIKPNVQESGDGNSRKQGAQPGHKGHFRRMPSITERKTTKASDFQS